MRSFIISIFTIIFIGISCKNNHAIDTSGILTGASDIKKGEELFIANCSGCHNFKMDAMGPHLGGLTKRVETQWLVDFIKNPQAVVERKDMRADSLYRKYKVMMAAYDHLGDKAIQQIVAYMHTIEAPQEKVIDALALTNPITDTIEDSGLVLNIEEVTQFPVSSENMKKPLARITYMDIHPISGERLVLDLRGKLYRLNGNTPEIFMDISKLEPNFLHNRGLATGFGSFAFHPDFERNGLFYTSHAEPANSKNPDFVLPDSATVNLQWVLKEWKIDPSATKPIFTKGREMIRIDFYSQLHGMQEISFNPLSKPGDLDYGLLYICLGDGGAVENGFPQAAGTLSQIYGSVLRIDPMGRNSKNKSYGIPNVNPYSSSHSRDTLTEIFAYGFRNPHRITWTKKGQLLVSNIGHSNIESMYELKGGEHCGWPNREGSFVINPYGEMTLVYQSKDDSAKNAYHVPFLQFDHDEGKAICGGLEYWGNKVGELKDKILFGDIPTGRLFYITSDEVSSKKLAKIFEWHIKFNGKVQSLRTLCGNDRVDLHFGRDGQGELYMMTKADGRLYKIIND